MRYLYLLLPILLTACVTNGAGDGRVKITTATNGQELIGANCSVMTNATMVM